MPKRPENSRQPSGGAPTSPGLGPARAGSVIRRDRSNSDRSRSRSRSTSQKTATPAQGGGSKLLFLTSTGNPSEWQNDRANRSVIKKWASTTGLENIERAASPNEGPRVERRGRPSASKVREKQLARSSATPEEGQFPSREAGPSSASLERSDTSTSSRSRQDTPVIGTYGSPALSQEEMGMSGGLTTPARGASIDSGTSPSALLDQARLILDRSEQDAAIRQLMPSFTSSIRQSISLAQPTGLGFGDSPKPGVSALTGGPMDLLDFYLNAHLLSEALLDSEVWEGEGPLIESNRSIWFALLRHSKAAYSALVTYNGTTARSLSGENGERYFQYHLQRALRNANQELADPDLATGDGTCLGVLLLMITANRMNDMEAFRTHARGLALILAHRRDQTGGLPGFDITGRDQSALTAQLAGVDLQQTSSLPTPNPRSSTTRILSHVPSAPSSLLPHSFDTLLPAGIISSNPHTVYTTTLHLFALANLAKRSQDEFATAALTQHIFLSSLQPLPPHLTPVETAILCTLRLIMYVSVRPDRSADDPIVRDCISQLWSAFGQGEVVDLCRKRGIWSLLVWMGLTAGSQIRDNERRRELFGGLVGEAVGFASRSGFSGWQGQGQGEGVGSDAVIAFLDERFVWDGALSGDAGVFWEECVIVDDE